jgi:hypothetical protein
MVTDNATKTAFNRELDVQLLELIGRGTHAEVFKAYWHGTLVAVKRIHTASLSQETATEVHREVALMQYAEIFVAVRCGWFFCIAVVVVVR